MDPVHNVEGVKRNAAAKVPRSAIGRWRWLLPVVALVVTFHLSGLGPALDRAFFDAASRRPWREPVLDPAASAIVVVDEHTLALGRQEGYGARWPFPRFAFAGLIASLHRAGAERIVMDFTFLEPSDSVDQDVLLAGVAAVTPGLVLARMPTQPPVFWDNAFITAHAPYFTKPRSGNAHLDTDRDGVARQYTLQDSLAAVAAGADPLPPSDDRPWLRWHGGLEQLKAKGVPVLSAAAYLADGLPRVDRLLESALVYPEHGDADATPELDAAALAAAFAAEPPVPGTLAGPLRGRTVFVGANAAGTYDAKPVPLGSIEPGVLLHWTAWTNLQANDFIHALPSSVPLALAVVVIVLLAVVGARQGKLFLALAIATGAAALVAFSAYVLLSHGWFIGPSTPVTAAMLGFAGVAVEGFWTEHRRRREVQTMFGSYVDPTVVDRLVRDPNAIRLGGERREATVFFCDLAGFTDLSEQVSPETLLALINRYLEETSDCLLTHGAYIDKYIGDAVMAVFGAPLDDAEHAFSAGCAALATQQMLARINQDLTRQHGRALNLRIGLNTGSMIVGNLGSSRKRNYTVLGDAVNLASRLEGANKEFGTAILVGEETARQIGDRLVLRPLTRLRVKGRQQAVEVSELIAHPDALRDRQREFLRHYRPAYDAFVGRRFAEAAKGFAAALAVQPEDGVTRMLLAESARLTHTPPSADWEPVLTLSNK